MAVSSAARPAWAVRIREEREARGWSQRQLVGAMRVHSDKELAGDDTLLRRVKSWEAGEHQPEPFYRRLIAKTFGTVTAAIWPEQRQDSGLIEASGMDTLEILTRLRSSSVDQATLDALRITVDRLCSDYPHTDPRDLAVEGRQWLGRITGMLDRRMTLAQHQEVLALAGLLALLTGCVEYDMGSVQNAETTRRAALSLGEEAGAAEVIGWAHEMRAWFALTQGDYRGVIQAAEAGEALAPGTRAAVQLAAQRAKAWARVGDRRQVEVALDKGRAQLDSMPYPDNLDNHFTVDPAKWDFYAMDCYRLLGAAGGPASTENRLAQAYAEEIIRAGTGLDGQERTPMRIAEARVTLGVVSARQGDVEGAVAYGRAALAGGRKSLPSLLMVSSELAREVSASGDAAPATEYLDDLRGIRAAVAAS
jgi:transcriptional regulator with XRE-family HTH domain/tetratricopeptide (TPR) repeat protein